MKNEIKLPRLSTSFSASGKCAKKRFENILNMKNNRKGIAAFSSVILLIAFAGTLVACNNTSVGIIGGADGPTAIFTTKKNSSKSDCENLYDARCKYIGSPSDVGKIIGLLEEIDGAQPDGMQLQTTTEPYGLIRWLNGEIKNKEQLEKQSAIILSLIENAGYVSYSLDKGETTAYSFSKEQLGVHYAQSYEEFEELYNSLYPSGNKINIDEAVSKAIFAGNTERYLDGECMGEGHIILGEDNSENGGKIVYVLTTYGEYGFENNAFIKVSGSGIIPVRITFDSDYNMIEYKMPMDGSKYAPSCKEIFPKKYWNDVLNYNYEKNYEICKEQEKKYASEYLKKIGRQAQIGEYADVEHILDDMETSASNRLMDLFYEYPYWIGTQERIENGIRYVYEKQWEPKGDGNGIVTYKKFEYDTKKTVQETVIDVSNGEILTIRGEPRLERK